MQRANEFITDILISIFANTLGGLDAIESPEELTNEFGKDKLLKRDVYQLVEKISPLILFVGILSGGITTAKPLCDHKNKHQDKTSKEGDTKN